MTSLEQFILAEFSGRYFWIFAPSAHTFFIYNIPKPFFHVIKKIWPSYSFIPSCSFISKLSCSSEVSLEIQYKLLVFDPLNSFWRPQWPQKWLYYSSISLFLLLFLSNFIPKQSLMCPIYLQKRPQSEDFLNRWHLKQT